MSIDAEGDNSSEGAKPKSGFFNRCGIFGTAVYTPTQQHFLVMPVGGATAPSETSFTLQLR